eukprot:gnl/TRDRNA2_/TRDRNA2_92505_c0_seq1.p1 gnl/TRDRNA2_/TRDRNA2_92505_c0~~gnl/TRDRNA2_/TRDRNA2_92505_c0_seq1.p1  ORF type:complete len:142 (+),score=23.11 gnl/TRDRNA2_/TRDRNA2_92505_c0_seq1:108-533(+)
MLSTVDNGKELDWFHVWLALGTNFVWTFAVLILREVSSLIADPFSHAKNGINAERYLDLSISGMSRLVAYNHTAPDCSQDPNFVMMAHKDDDEWGFKERRKLNIAYLRDNRRKALQLKERGAALLRAKAKESLQVPLLAGH